MSAAGPGRGLSRSLGPGPAHPERGKGHPGRRQALRLPALVARVFFVCFCFFTRFPIYLFHDRVECMIFNTMHMVL